MTLCKKILRTKNLSMVIIFMTKEERVYIREVRRLINEYFMKFFFWEWALWSGNKIKINKQKPNGFWS